jgi:hypothetical protein
VAGANPPRQLDAGLPRHLDIEQSYVRLMLFNQGLCLQAVGRLSHNFDLATLQEKIADPFADHSVIIG